MKTARDKVIMTLCAIWFMVGILAMMSHGENGEFTWLNVAGLVVFAGFACFSNVAEQKGWIKFSQEDDEA